MSMASGDVAGDRSAKHEIRAVLPAPDRIPLAHGQGPRDNIRCRLFLRFQPGRQCARHGLIIEITIRMRWLDAWVEITRVMAHNQREIEDHELWVSTVPLQPGG